MEDKEQTRLQNYVNSQQFKVRQGIVNTINAVITEERGGEREAFKVSTQLNPLIVELIATVPPEEAARVIAASIHDAMQVVCRIGFAA